MHGGELIGCDSSMHLSHRGLLTLDTLGMLEREEEEQPATQQPLSQSMPPEGAREGLLPEVENDGSTSHRESKNNAKRRIAYYINEENKHDASVYAAPPMVPQSRAAREAEEDSPPYVLPAASQPTSPAGVFLI